MQLDTKTLRKEVLRRHNEDQNTSSMFEPRGDIYTFHVKELVSSVTCNEKSNANLIIVQTDNPKVKTLLDGMFAYACSVNLPNWASELIARGHFVGFIDYNEFGVSNIIPFPQNEMYHFEDPSGFRSLFSNWFWHGPGTKIGWANEISFYVKPLEGNEHVYGEPLASSYFRLLSTRIRLRTALEQGLKSLAFSHLQYLQSAGLNLGSDEPKFKIFLDTPMIKKGIITNQPTIGAIRNFDGTDFDLSQDEGIRDYKIEESDKRSTIEKFEAAHLLLSELKKEKTNTIPPSKNEENNEAKKEE